MNGSRSAPSHAEESKGEQRAGVLVAIALFKLVKAVALIALGIGALFVARGSHILTGPRHVIAELGFDPYNHHIDRALSAVFGADPRRLEALGVATFGYAAVFLVEGMGLLLRKRWAEYLTTIVTASFVPVEIYELAHKPSALKGIGLAVNVLIVGYLVVRLWRQRSK
jgi:uncharacterized membrane protein (DUF2068 family)